MTICFDIDDTISTHLHRDYKNATPIMEVLDKIRALKGNGCRIILYTARGMLSCNGDASLAESKNRAVLEQMFEGVVRPVGKDENGDLVYKYVGK